MQSIVKGIADNITLPPRIGGWVPGRIAKLKGSKQEEKEAPLVTFDRNELSVGALLGRGAFCLTFEVKKITLDSSKASFALKEGGTARETYQDQDSCFGAMAASQMALKVVDPELLQLSEEEYMQAAADLLAENRLLSKLHHPNMVKLMGMCGSQRLNSLGDPEKVFVLMEKLPSTLSEEIEMWKMEEDNRYVPDISRRIDYAHQVASVIMYLHSKRIAYCDLKPQNIGFRGSMVKLFDFGQCVDLTGMPRRGLCDIPTTVTPRYSSPEMLLESGYNEKTDVYSWAMVFYEMLTLRKPYDDLNILELSDRVCTIGERPPFGPIFNIPSSIENLLKKSWEHDIFARLSMSRVCKILGDIAARKGAAA